MYVRFLVATLLLVIAMMEKTEGNSQQGSVGQGKSCTNIDVNTFLKYCCKDGRDGRDGKDGRDAKMGRKGSKGEQGLKGNTGPPGTCSCNNKIEEMQSNMTELNQRLAASSGLHFFDKAQDLPTKCAAAVRAFKINGDLYLAFANYNGDTLKHKAHSVIYKMTGSTMTPFQILATRGAYGVEHFQIGSDHYLAVSNRYDGTYQTNSIVYKWNGNRFLQFQTIATKSVRDMIYFTIRNQIFLCISSCQDGSSYSINSYIYKWQNNRFVKFQDIRTEGAMGCSAFSIENQHFVAFASYINSANKYAVQSMVFKWTGARFVKFQSLQTYGAHDVHYFAINGLHFLGFSCYYTGSKYNIDSFIYRWDGSRFILFQSIPTRGAVSMRSFVVSGDTYLSVANYHGDSLKYKVNSVVYKAVGAQFVKYQELKSRSAYDMDVFKYKGYTYLALANCYDQDANKRNTNSFLYKWI